MTGNKIPYERIAFVCVNQRDDGRPCCANGGAQELRDALKARVKAAGLAGRVRVSQSGCQGQCATGPNVMIFPEGIWFNQACLEDVDTIYAALTSGIE